MRTSFILLTCGVLFACSDAATQDPGSTERTEAPGPDVSAPSATGSSGTTPPPSTDGGIPGARVTGKRGLAYGHHSLADMRAISAGISWWYNWAYEPDQALRAGYSSLGVEYVPMAWGAKSDPADLASKLLAGATTLLGFNEPNFFEQANLSATDAAARWPAIQSVADSHGLRLLSPAVNFCGGGCHSTDPFAYLDAFFAACKGCRVDALAVHVYVGCKGEAGNHAKWLIDHLKTYERRFSQPIWLTEFACNDAATEEEQRLFMVDAVTYLESDPRIERYAWFAGRADNVPHVDLLGADGQLTALGRTYVGLPRKAP